MTEEYNITQKAAIGSETTQIAQQTNYFGMSAEDASKLAIDLFMDNFPKLQEIAMATARARVEELMKSIIEKHQHEGTRDFTSLASPDMQYVLYEAQKGYARLGTETLLSMLGTLVVKRMDADNDVYRRIVLNKAIEVAPMMQQLHLDYLSLIFLVKNLRFQHVKNVSALVAIYEEICSKMQCPEPPESMRSADIFLDMLGCFSIGIGSAASIFAKSYGFSEEEMKTALPSMLNKIPGEYILTPVAICLAIVNANNKEFSFNIPLENFIQSP